MSEDTYVSFGSLRTGALLSYRPNSEILIKISEDTVALLRDVEGGAHVRFLQGNSHTSVFPRQVHAAEQEPVRWSNGCNQSVPRALRYLATHDRPIGGQEAYNSEHLYQLASEIERMASKPLYNAPPLPADTVKKFKFDTLVEHCKRQEEENARMSAELSNLRVYTDGEAWHWQGDGQDFLGSLTCPVVINAEDLRELLKLAVAAAAPVEGKAAVVLGDDLYVHSVKSVLRLNDDGLWANFELNGKHVGINLDHVEPAKFFCAEFRAKYGTKPKCDGNHGGPRCADPECWNDDQPGVVVRSGVINSVSDFSEVDALMTPWPVAVARDGVGLPPVGIHCEYGAASEFDPIPLNLWLEGDKIKCVAHIEIKGASPLPLFWNERTFSASTVAAHCYRPIRTPEQIAAEERIKAAQEWLKGVEREYGVEVADKCEDILVAAEAKRVAK